MLLSRVFEPFVQQRPIAVLVELRGPVVLGVQPSVPAAYGLCDATASW